jgi:RNA polymerase sigma factor (sigma-70 family)
MPCGSGCGRSWGGSRPSPNCRPRPDGHRRRSPKWIWPQRRETADGLALEGLLGTEAPEEGLVERIALREAVDQLPEKERMTILLRYFKGLTQERAARVLGVSQVQVSRLERRGLERLRQSFAE